MAKKSIAKNYIYNLVYQVLLLILPLITTPYISRVLGSENVGIYAYTYSIVTYFILFGSLGVALYGQREIAYAQENKDARTKVFWEICIFRFVTVSIATVIYFFFFMQGREYQIYYQILMLELIAAAFDISWFFQGLEEFKRTVTRNILVRLISVTLVFVLVKTKEDLTKFTLIYSLADLLGNLSLWLYLPKYMKGAKIKNLNVVKHIPQIILLFVPQIANQVYNMLDKTMIGEIITDKSEVGFYEQAQKVIRLSLTIVSSLGIVMVPRMANTFASGDKEKINRYLKNSFAFVFFLGFPVTFGIVSIAEAFVPEFFGPGYDKVVPLIYIISPIILLMGIANVIGTQYLLPTKKQKEYTISVTMGVIVNFIMNYILIKKYAAIGASIATVVSQLVVDIWQIYYIRKEIRLKTMFSTAPKYLFAGLIMYGVCQATKYIINTGLESIFLQIGVGVSIYMITLFIFRDEYLYTVLDKIIGKKGKREKA